MSSNTTDHHLSGLRTAEELEKYLAEKGLCWADAHLPDPQLFRDGFRVRIPYYYANLINWTDPSDPLKMMVVPDPHEKDTKEYELSDPIGDQVREAVPGLIHRYPDRCLLLLTSYCLVHCRFCFRREVVGKARPVQFQRIQKYLAEHSEVKEIIFSGGDPFTFPIGFLESMRQHFAGLSHIQTWRFHTRIPAGDPTAVSDEWIAQLALISKKDGKQVIVVTHVNHPREVTKEFEGLVEKLRVAGAMVLSQTVLLKNVNTNSETLEELFRKLVRVGVKPYYLHHLDQVVGSHHFRISIEEGKKLFSSLRGKVSSVCLPEYVIDLPGGFGKVPVMWLKELGNRKYQTKNFEGKTVEYQDMAD